jgi:hypothetical protein
MDSSAAARAPGRHSLVVLHPAGQIDVEVEIEGVGAEAAVSRAALVRTARKIMQGELHLPDYVFSRPEAATSTSAAFPRKAITIIVPTRAGGGNDTMARIIAARLGPLLGQQLLVDVRAGANGAVASEYVAEFSSSTRAPRWPTRRMTAQMRLCNLMDRVTGQHSPFLAWPGGQW